MELVPWCSPSQGMQLGTGRAVGQMKGVLALWHHGLMLLLTALIWEMQLLPLSAVYRKALRSAEARMGAGLGRALLGNFGAEGMQEWWVQECDTCKG